MTIRPATGADLTAIATLWNTFIRDTTVTFSSEEKTAETVAALIDGRRRAGREFFVAEERGHLQGFASYDQFRGGNGYAHAMEHTVLLAADARGLGVGRRLMQSVEGHARDAGAHTLFAGVSGENPAGIAFHERIGFQRVATIPEVGRKFGRWLTLVLMQKML